MTEDCGPIESALEKYIDGIKVYKGICSRCGNEDEYHSHFKDKDEKMTCHRCHRHSAVVLGDEVKASE